MYIYVCGRYVCMCMVYLCVSMCVHGCLYICMNIWRPKVNTGCLLPPFFFFRNVITELQFGLTLEILFSDTSRFYINAGAIKPGHYVYIATLRKLTNASLGFVVVIVVVSFLQDRPLLYNPGWPGTH